MSQIQTLGTDVTDIPTIVAKINEIIKLGEVKYGQGMTWWNK